MIIRIGIDIDDTMTIIQDDLFQAACLYDQSIGNSGIPINNDYYIGKRFNWSNEEYQYFMSEIRKEVVNNAKIRDGLKEFLNMIHQDGNEIIIISARSNMYYKDPWNMTEEWLKKHDIIYDKLIINCRNKKEMCHKEKIDLFIDDEVFHCQEVNNLGVKTLIMDNKNNILDNKEIIRIKDFYDAIKEYKKLKEKLYT